MTYYMCKYEWTAFTEADLLANGRNGTDFGCGDSFVMPGKATVKMSTYDDDNALNGDNSWWYGNDYSEDRYGQDAYVNNAAVGCKMYAEQYHVLHGSDGRTYYLIEIEVEGHSAPGMGNSYFTFYGARPPAGVNLTVTQTCNVSGCWVDYRCLGAGETAPPNTPPTFTNVPANGVFCVDENTKLVIDLNAQDADHDSLTFSIAGGHDAAAFTIDAQTGVLEFKAAPDYESPASADGDNTYQVIVKVDDGRGGVATKCLTVNVCDVDEPGGPQECVVIEAEDMQLCNFYVGCASSASDGAYIYGNSYYSSYAQTVFNGTSGDYDLTLRYWDAQGDGKIAIYVNGSYVAAINTTANDNQWHDFALDQLNLKDGDVIKLVATGCEQTIIDKITLCPTPPQPGALEGRIFIDANKDGIDNTEPGVSGVTVTLLTAAGVVAGTAVTAADGGYRFTDLAPGEYSVVFPTTLEGRVLTTQNVGTDDSVDSDADVTTGQTGTYAVAAGETVSNVDAGLKDPGTAALQGRVFFDENDNNVDNDEPGLADVTVELRDGAGVLITSTQTGADGSYAFTGLDAGSYIVQFPTSVNGLKLVEANVGGNEAIDSDADPATGQTAPVSLAIGELKTDIDAGVKDPATASLGNFVWLDADKDGLQDANEAGFANVLVTLYNEAGQPLDSTTTDANGFYLFDGLKAGSYRVGFAAQPGYDFTTPGVGGNEAIDSNAYPATGLTAPIALGLGETNLTIDAGLVLQNRAPVAMDDAGQTCADTATVVDVLANDSDADGDALTITAVAGQAITEGQTITASDGVLITLSGGKLVFDASGSAYADAVVGTSNSAGYGYSVADGNGGVASANIAMTYCGSNNTLESITASLPDMANIVVTLDIVGDAFYTATLSGTGDARFDGKSFDIAYCANANLFLDTDVSYAATMSLASEADAPASVVNAQNLDMVNWILNQGFDSIDNGDGTGKTYTGGEIQGAIWGLTDDYLFVNEAVPAFGTIANAQEIYQLALANGEGFTPGEGDIVGIILDPLDPTGVHGIEQPFIIGVAFNDLALDCLC